MQRCQDVCLISVPYDSGHRGLRMGAGPEYLLENGLGEALGAEGRSAISTTVRPESGPLTEVATAFELNGLVSEQVRGAVSEGELPLVLSGSCNTSVGTRAGVGPGGLGILWFDARGVMRSVLSCLGALTGHAPRTSYRPRTEARR